MKKSLIAFVLVCTMLMSVLGMAAADGSYTPGTYTAEAKGMGGTVTVTVTVSDSAITAVKAEGPDETPGIGVPALETVANAILEAQSADVDGVTGATVTSTAVKTAAAAALAEAAGGADRLELCGNLIIGDAPLACRAGKKFKFFTAEFKAVSLFGYDIFEVHIFLNP